MKKSLLLSLCMSVFAIAMHAQTEPTIVSDVTLKLQNADFSADTPVSTTVYTYDYNMPDDGVGAGGESLFGMQAVTGWTASAPSDNVKIMQNSEDKSNVRSDEANAKASGVFAYLDPDANLDEQPGLGGPYYAPFYGSEAAEGGQSLGLVSVWGATLQYTQDVTLPAGDYMMIARIYNASGTVAVASSRNGFAGGDVQAYSAKTAYPSTVWENDTIIFRLAAETTGKISLGYVAAGAGSSSMPHLFIDNVKLYQIDAKYLDQKAIDEAKETLLKLIDEGKLYNVDVVPAEEVYNDSNATLEEVLQAIEAQKARNEAGLTDLSEFFIINPHFSEGQAVEGGICTYGYDCATNGISTDNFSLLPVEGWTPNVTKSNGPAGGVFAVGSGAFLGGKDFVVPTAMSDDTTEGQLLGIVTCWSNSAFYKQDVTLPAGSYTISMSYYNAGGADAVEKNLIGFVANDGTEHLGETKSFPVGKWTTETLKFDLEGETSGYFTVGYKSTDVGSGKMPHLFVDGFSLIYVGTGINASLLALNAMVSGANKLLSEDFNADLRKQLADAVDAGQALVLSQSEDDEANKAATEAIKALLGEVNASIAAYKSLNTFRDDVNAARIKYNVEEYPELNVTLTNMLDDVDSALRSLDWTTSKIEETIASLNTIIKEGVKKQWDAVIASGKVLAKDLDISVLFDQMAYPYSTSAATNPTIEKWTKTGDGQFKTQFGTAEIWSGSAINSFKVSSTLTELPVGKYTISTKAFFRNADNATNFTNYNETNTPEARLFAGANTVGLTNVAALANDIEGQTGWTSANGDEAAPYVPNNQEAAYNIFNNDEYTSLIQKSVSTVVPQNGSLEFGISAEGMEANAWTIWYTFTVTYNAPTASDVADVLEALKIQAATLQDEVKVVKAADEKIENAKRVHENADMSSVEALMDVMAMYVEAIAYAEKSDSLYKVMVERYDIYTELMSVVESEEPSYHKLMEEIGSIYEEVGGIEDNEKLQEYIDAIKDKWAAFVQYPVLETSSLDDPGNITTAIYNYSFIDPATQVAGLGGWTYTSDGGNEIKTGGSEENPAAEFYNNNSFNFYQTLKGLAEGYYQIRVQSFYRAGAAQANADSLTAERTYGQNVKLYAKTESGEVATSVKNILQREDEEGSLETGQSATGGETVVKYAGEDEFYIPNDMTSFCEYTEIGIYWNEVKVHLKAGETLTLGLFKDTHIDNDWTIFNNFELYYLGNDEAPDAINAVEVNGEKASAAIYNLAGQRVAKAVKGLYIMDGKKVVVK